MAGNGTIGLEILEDLPEVDAIVVPCGGGGLTCGIAAAVRALRPTCRVYAAEVETAAPLAASLAAGAPRAVDYRHRSSTASAARRVFPQMLERARGAASTAALVVTLDEVAAALRLLAERNRVDRRGRGRLPRGLRALGPARARGKIVCVVSGGNIDLDRFASLVAPASTLGPFFEVRFGPSTQLEPRLVTQDQPVLLRRALALPAPDVKPGEQVAGAGRVFPIVAPGRRERRLQQRDGLALLPRLDERLGELERKQHRLRRERRSLPQLDDRGMAPLGLPRERTGPASMLEGRLERIAPGFTWGEGRQHQRRRLYGRPRKTVACEPARTTLRCSPSQPSIVPSESGSELSCASQ